MLYSVCLNDRPCEEVERYSVGKHVVDVRRRNAGNESGAISLKKSQYRLYKRTTLGHLFTCLGE